MDPVFQSGIQFNCIFILLPGTQCYLSQLGLCVTSSIGTIYLTFMCQNVRCKNINILQMGNICYISENNPL